MNRAVFAAIIAALLPVTAAQSKPPLETLAASVAASTIAPKFADLDKAFAAQAQAWNKDCAATPALRSAFQDSYDAWAQTEFFRAGPLSRQTLAERIDYWPDPRNAIDKGLKELLASPNASDITPEKAAAGSVAAQGLPALERLLYSNADSNEAKAIGEKECAAGRAIARNLADLAQALDKEWNDPSSGEVTRLKALSTDPAKARESAVALLTDLATAIRIIEDKKMPPLYGAKGNAPNPHAAKAWRSGRSEHDLSRNIETLIEAYKAAAPFAPDAAQSVVEKLQDAAVALAASKDDPNRTIALVAAVNNAKYYAIDVLPSELGVSLGFNSLDGD